MFPSIVENLSLIQNAGIPTSTDSTANLQESSMKLESQSDGKDYSIIITKLYIIILLS